jgi:hypothetical protein
MRITSIAAGLLVLSTAIGIAAGMAVLRAARAAEGSNDAGSVLASAEAADQTGLKQGTTTIETNNPADGSKQRLATARLGGCKSQFKLADLNGDGVLDAGETKHYNSSIRSDKQPVVPEDARLDERGFIAACSTVSAHE